jgi:RNA polymerase sigma-70 factor (ECF subfamily)
VTPHPLERFIDEYADRGYDFALTLSGSPEEAKELVQAAFVRAFERWPQYDPNQSFEGWFLGILKNLYRDWIKRYERRNVSLDAPLGGDEEALPIAELVADGREEALLERLERQAAGEEVRRALEGLSPEHRAVLSLSDMQGLTYEEVGQALDLPLGTVKSRLVRARDAFKKRMLRSEVKKYGV